MRKLRNIMILLLTLGLLAVGAGLPGLVAAVVDQSHLNRSGSREMASVALDLSGERQSLTTAGKLDLLRRCNSINITDKEATMTEAEVNAAVETAMAEYIDAGIFEWFDITAWTTQSKLCVDPDSPDNYAIFWMVTIVSETEPYETLTIDLDDETGKIFSIRYDKYEEYSLDGVWERNRAVMDAFIHVYLNQLGLLEENAEPYVEYGELDGELLWGGFSFTDDTYGEIGIEFYVTGSGGLWVYFPK